MEFTMSCAVCRKPHPCGICGARMAQDGYHVCRDCVQRMQAMYAAAMKRAEEVGWDAMMQEQRTTYQKA